MLALAEKVHLYFRGSSEVSKWAKTTALFLDLFSGAIAIAGIFGSLKYFWVPLFILGSAVLSSALRSYANNIRSYSQRARRTSLRAFCLEIEIDPLTASNFSIESPVLAEWFASKLPAQSMNDYYEPVSPKGEIRLRELYAHSAFYTWRLLRISSFLAFIWSSIVFVGSFVVIYYLADAPRNIETTKGILESLSTVALVILCVRGVEYATTANLSAKEVRSIEESLQKKPHGRSLIELADSYEIERASGPDVPTIIYYFLRNKLQKQWFERRKTIV